MRGRVRVTTARSRAGGAAWAWFLVVLVLSLSAIVVGLQRQNTAGSIKVGVLHSLTGTMAISEKAVVDATLLAIDEVNQRGGVNGRKLIPVVVDGASDWPTFAAAAERLISQDRVAVVFGCWTSASRRTVRPVFEKHDHLLMYPVQYEGLEQSPNIIYLGAAPNQQIMPAVKWSLDHLGKRVYLVGSDYVFPRTANAIVRAQVGALSGSVVGESYLPLGDTRVDAVVADIVRTRPQVILNTINGDTNAAFFKALRAAGITPTTIPTVSFSIAESELKVMGAADFVGDYAVWNYYQSVTSKENAEFVDQFRGRYGMDRVISDPMEAAYSAVHLWANAAARTGETDPRLVRQAMRGQSFAAPGGAVYVDPDNQHLWKPVRVGRIRTDGQFDVVWNSGRPVRPVPYPPIRTRSEWDGFLTDLYNGWGQRWAYVPMSGAPPAPMPDLQSKPAP